MVSIHSIDGGCRLDCVIVRRRAKQDDFSFRSLNYVIQTNGLIALKSTVAATAKTPI